MVGQQAWDMMVTGAVLGGIALWIITGVTKMTVKELIMYMKDIITGDEGDIVDSAMILTE